MPPMIDGFVLSFIGGAFFFVSLWGCKSLLTITCTDGMLLMVMLYAEYY